MLPWDWRVWWARTEPLRSWFDPRTRRPLVLLFLVAMLALSWPATSEWGSLLLDIVLPAVEWWLGQSAMLAMLAIGCWRLWQVRPGDSWPSSTIDPAPTRSLAALAVPWALRLIVASLALPMLRDMDGLGFADWDFVLDKYEAARRTILIWHQFPWWNPWCRGGFPLAAEPQIGAVSPVTPLILGAGTAIGLRIATVLQIAIAMEGSYRLALLWLREPIGAALAAMVYALNGAVSVDTVDGYIIAMSYSVLPWLAYHAFRIREGLAHGIGLGAWAALAVLNGVQYLTMYAALLVFAIGLRAVRVGPEGDWRATIRPALAAAGTFLLLAGWRSATMLPVLLQDRRERVTFWDEPPLAALRSLVDRPRPDWIEFVPGRYWDYYCSVTSYIGVGVAVLVAVSMLRGWRWWHTMIVLTAWLAIGSIRWYHPSRWLADWPILGSAHVVTRWRFVTMLGFGLAAGSVVARWRLDGGRIRAAIAVAATLILSADYVVIAHEQLPQAFSTRPDPPLFPGPPITEIVNIHHGLGYTCVLRGYGVIEGYEPMLSYIRDAPTLRKARGQPGYRGEAWTDEGEVRPVYWSPNRLVFQVRPGQTVHVNQNPGSWWLANGRRIFADLRCAEPMRDLAAQADQSGHLELRIEPPQLRLGIALHFLGAGMILATIRLRRRD